MKIILDYNNVPVTKEFVAVLSKTFGINGEIDDIENRVGIAFKADCINPEVKNIITDWY